MKIIKFRAWDKNGDGMFYDIQSGIDFDDGSHYSFNDFLQPKTGDIHDWVVMQFTGLTDKNGKEIYEGDIVKAFDMVQISEVFWDSNMGAWAIISQISGVMPPGHLFIAEYIEKVEVIGNKYENPELLKNIDSPGSGGT